MTRKLLKFGSGIGGSIIILLIGIAIGNAASGPSGSPAPVTTIYVTPSANPAVTHSSAAKAKAKASPAAPVNAQTLIHATGANQNWNSPPFSIGTQPVTVTYSYRDCQDGTGNFIADLITAGVSESDFDHYEDINISNALGSGASNTTVEYPQHPGARYYLSINTDCTYDVKVVSGK